MDWREPAMMLFGSRRRAAPMVLAAGLVMSVGAIAAPTGPAEVASGAYLGAYVAQSQRDLGSAARFMAEVQKADPDNVEIMRRTFVLNLSAGYGQEAARLAVELDALAGRDPVVRTVIALDRARQGQWDQASRFLAGMEETGLSRIVTPLIVAWLEVGRGDRAAALAQLDRLGQVEGFRIVMLVHKGLVLDLTGDLPGAAAYLEEATTLGTSVRLVEALGSVLQRQGNIAKARAVYDAFLAENPDNSVVLAALAALDRNEAPRPAVSSALDGIGEALFYVASALSQEGADDPALLHARLMEFVRPDFDLGRILLGDLLAGREQPQDALAAYDSVPDSAPEAYLARLRSTAALQDLERYDEGIARLEALTAAYPDRPDPFQRMGDLYRIRKEWQRAIDAYDRASGLDPTLATEDWGFLFRRGIALERAREWDRCEEDLRRATEINPENAQLLNYLGYSLLDRGLKIEESERLIEKAVRLAPNDGFIVDSLGWLYYRTGRLAQAVEALERAVALESVDATLNDHLGDAYWVTGREREARYQWERALIAAERDEDEEMAGKIRAKLASGLVETGILNSANGPVSPVDPDGTVN